jgi:hypothetical protein
MKSCMLLHPERKRDTSCRPRCHSTPSPRCHTTKSTEGNRRHRQCQLSKRHASRAMLAVGANPPFDTAATRVPDADHLYAFHIAISAQRAVSVIEAILTYLPGGSTLGNLVEDLARKPVVARISPVVTITLWHEKEAQLSAYPPGGSRNDLVPRHCPPVRSAPTSSRPARAWRHRSRRRRRLWRPRQTRRRSGRGRGGGSSGLTEESGGRQRVTSLWREHLRRELSLRASGGRSRFSGQIGRGGAFGVECRAGVSATVAWHGWLYARYVSSLPWRMSRPACYCQKRLRARKWRLFSQSVRFYR